MSYQINENYISKNRSGQGLNPIGMVVHDTATPGATDENEQSYFNGNNVQASAHAFIDWDSITQTVPDDEVAWGSGPTSNHRFLQVELCNPASHDVAKFQEVWNRAVWYFAYKFVNVLKIKTVTKDNLMSHAEVSNRWGETDHQDPIAYFREYGKTVDQFRQAVQNEINSGISDNTAPSIIGSSLELQQLLNKLGYKGENGESLKEDGDLGVNSTFAIKSFQAAQGLLVDGDPGINTWTTLRSLVNKPTQPKEEEKKNMKNLILYNSIGDFKAVTILSAHIHAPAIERGLETQEDAQAENIFEIGGTQKYPKSKLLSGADSIATELAVLKFIGRV